MHIASYLAYEQVHLEVSVFGQSITMSIGEPKYGNSISVTLSRTQTEALGESLQAALQQILTPNKEYPDITVRRLWEAKAERPPVIEVVEAQPEATREPAPISIAA